MKRPAIHSAFSQCVLRIGMASLLSLAGACGDSAEPLESALTTPNGSSTGSPGDSARNQPSGAVAGIRISMPTPSLALNGSMLAMALPVDANGIPSLALIEGRPVWRIANAAIATVDAEGKIRAVNAGSTRLYAQWHSYKDSAQVTVRTSADSSPNGGGNGGGGVDTTRTPPGPVASFNLSAYVLGRAAPTSPRDTANVVQLAGATVSVYRYSSNPAIPPAAGDPPIQRMLFKTVTTDANGKATVSNVPTGYYFVSATATYQGNAFEGSTEFAPPRTNEFAVALYLNRK